MRNLNKNLNNERGFRHSAGIYSYSKTRFGRDAEFVIALYMLSKGWTVRLSKGSRGPADLYACKASDTWYIQVKASLKAPRLKGFDIRKLVQLASSTGACPVVALLQPSANAVLENTVSGATSCLQVRDQKFCVKGEFLKFDLSFFNLPTWAQLEP